MKFNEIPEVRYVYFLASADIIVSILNSIKNFIKCNERLAQWDGKTTCIS